MTTRNRRPDPPLVALVATYAVVIAVCFAAGAVVGRLLL
jgi:hypothetical protein